MVRLAHFRGTVRAQREGEPLLSWVRELTGWSQNKARELVRQGKVYLDGKPALAPFDPVAGGVEVSIDTNRKKLRSLPDFNETRVLYRDATLVIVNKPPSMASVPPTRTGEPTLLDHLVRLMNPQRPTPLHRLDAETSGLMVFGVEGGDLETMRKRFRRHEIDRRYYAVVLGNPVEGVLEDDIDVTRERFGGERTIRRAVTHVSVVVRGARYNLVECRPETGRWHQLRIQLSLHGTPIVGEKEHVPPALEVPWSRRQGLALHSFHLALEHPTTGQRLQWTTPVPERLKRLMQQDGDR